MVGQTSVVRRVDLDSLAERINAAHDAFESGIRQSLAHAVEAGELLLQVKAALPHGRWLPWLDDNVGFSARTAQAYCRAAAHAERLRNAQTTAHLTLDSALKLLASEDAAQAAGGGAAADSTTWTVQDVIDTVTLGVQKWAERTPVECRAVLVKRLRGLADEIEKTGGVA